VLDSRWQLPEANRAAIVEATRRGIEVALVTGRRYDFAMPVARKLDSPLTMIVNNGALIRSKEGRPNASAAPAAAKQCAPSFGTDQAVARGAGRRNFRRRLENQLMLECWTRTIPCVTPTIRENKEFIGIANPLETCLTEDPSK